MIRAGRLPGVIAALAMLHGARSPIDAQQACAGGRPPITQFGQRLVDGQLLGDTPADVNLAALPKTRYFRLRFSLETDAPGWTLAVRSAAGRSLNLYDATSFGVTGHRPTARRTRWTDRIDGSFAQVDLLRRGAPGHLPAIRLDEYLVVAEDVKSPYYSYQDETAKKIRPLYQEGSLDLARLGDYVGMLFTGRNGMMWACSAIAVAPNLVMTNWHCGAGPNASAVDYWSQNVCDAAIVDFSWDDDQRSREFGCQDVLKPKSEELDVVFLRVRPIDRSDVLRPATLVVRAPADEPVVLIHHPEALAKQISRDCRVVMNPSEPLGEDRFAHTCDSEAGSSGAPVFDRRGQVLGLHHQGFTRDEKTCQPVGSVNKAIRIDRILAWLKGESSQDASDILNALTVVHQ